MKRVTISGVMLLVLVFCGVLGWVADSNYTLPPEGTKSLIKEIVANRNNDGTITLSGKALLPKGTKLLITFKSGKGAGQAEVVLGDEGNFSAGPFSDHGKSIKPGTYQVKFNSGRLTPGVQDEGVIALIGEGGSKLPKDALVPWDKEFPDEGRHISTMATVIVPPFTPEQIAIKSVQQAKLRVEGKGQAIDSIREVVAAFERMGGFKGNTWSATETGGKWTVTLTCMDGGEIKEAQWEYDSKTKKVRYLNHLAKVLSWLPPK
jgi:hypothetical protein